MLGPCRFRWAFAQGLLTPRIPSLPLLASGAPPPLVLYYVCASVAAASVLVASYYLGFVKDASQGLWVLAGLWSWRSAT